MSAEDMVGLSERELALATSGLATLPATLAANRALAGALAMGYPEPGDAASWSRLRGQGILGPGGATAVLPSGVVSDTLTIAGVGCLEVRPAEGEVRGTYLHFHGGGWSLGSAARSVGPLAELVAATGLRVISVEYPLAPEHHLDQILEACVRVATQVTRSAGFFAIGGESAGAHLAAVVLQRLRDAGSTPFAAAVLAYGPFDLAGTPGRLAHPRGSETERLARIVLGTTDPAVLRSPAYSPLYGSLEGMPPGRFMCGTRDGLLEDTLVMAARWSTVAETEVDLVAGAEHGFNLPPGATTSAARAREAGFLRRHMAHFDRS